MIEKITDEIIALVVTIAGTGCAGWICYQTGDIPEFYAVGFGMVLMHYFQKATQPIQKSDTPPIEQDEDR